VATGQSLDDIVRQLGDPSTLAESYLSAVPLVGAPFLRRAAAKILDVLVLTGAGFVIFAPLAWLLWSSSLIGTAIDATGIQHEMILAFMPLFAIVTVSLLFLIYTVLAEWQWGQTIGKYLLGVRAVRESGARISIGQAVVRHLPVILEAFWIDCLFALFTEKNHRAFECSRRYGRAGVAASGGLRPAKRSVCLRLTSQTQEAPAFRKDSVMSCNSATDGRRRRRPDARPGQPPSGQIGSSATAGVDANC
jgi:uncharacterized RDD family membrane protein YckC